MPIEFQKKYPNIACCGLDCGLCPIFHSKGTSNCPGCGGPNFINKHPPCGILSCNLKKKIECCAFCEEYPCEKMKKWDLGDSFISHKVCLKNLILIKEKGIQSFIEQQHKRMVYLEQLLKDFDDDHYKCGHFYPGDQQE